MGVKGLLQEKFQRTVTDPQTDGGNEWVSQASQRRTHETKEWHVTSDRPGADAMTHFDAPKTNELPPGMFIDNQKPHPNDHAIQYVAAGATDVSNSVDGRMLRKGFQRQEMLGTDDMYTNEHVEEFYGEAKGEDDAGNKYTGFLERNNMLDRN